MNHKTLNLKQRPLSPHQQAYSFNLTSFTSIFGRLCGFATFAFIFLTSWVTIIDTFFINHFLIAILDLTFINSNKILFYLSAMVMWGIFFCCFCYFFSLIKHLLLNFNIFIDIKKAKNFNIAVLSISFFLSIAVLYVFLKSLSQFKYLAGIA